MPNGESPAKGIAPAIAEETMIAVAEEEYLDSARRSLAALGMTYAELAECARRRDFPSAQAHSLWVSIGDTVNL